jgi:DNA-binding MarR family transcriptional regulator
MIETGTQSLHSLPLLPCTCANLRRASRAVTRLYNRELRPDGIEITQFTLLMVLDRTGDISQGRLCEILVLDSTTLTRTLKLLKKRGWVQAKEGDDRRMRIFRLTKTGEEKFRQSLRHWKRAQDHVQATLGDKTMSQLRDLLTKVTGRFAEE